MSCCAFNSSFVQEIGEMLDVATCVSKDKRSEIIFVLQGYTLYFTLEVTLVTK